MKKSSDKFDQIIKDKLDRLQVEYDPASWEAFERKLDAGNQPPANDAWLDEVVFEKLHGLESVGVPSRWDLMSARLDQEATRRRHTWSRRAMEAVLVLLISLTFVQYFGEQTPVRFTGKSSSASTPDASKQTADRVQKSPATPAPIADAQPGAASAPITQAQGTKPSVDMPPPAATTTARTTISKASVLPGIASEVKHLSKNTHPITDVPEPDQPLSGNRMDVIMAALDRLEVPELEKVTEDDHGFLIKPVNQQRGFYVSMFGSADYNQIVTPPTMVEGQMLEGFDRYELGYGGGIMAGWEKGRWEVGSGLIYVAKEYTPRPLLYIYDGSLRDGYQGEGFKLVELNMLQLPFHVRYNFIRHNKWRAYTTAGVSLHVTMQANYYIADETGFNRPAAARPPSQGPGGTVTTPLDEKASILTAGVLEGGSLLKNSYMTGNVGLGLERFMTERWSIFAQPTYHHVLSNKLQGIGPDQDRIHTMSIFMGLRVKL